MIEKGKRYYFLVHAYHHFAGEVVEVITPSKCILKNVVRVQSCSRGWSQFFRDGFRDDTNYTVWPDLMEVSNWFACAPWPHKIPKE